MKPKNVVDPLTQIIFVDIDVLSALGLNEHDASVVLITPDLPSSGICPDQDMAKTLGKSWPGRWVILGCFGGQVGSQLHVSCACWAELLHLPPCPIPHSAQTQRL